MSDRSPYFSRDPRYPRRRAPLWPKVLGLLALLALLTAGGVALYRSEYRISIARPNAAPTAASVAGAPAGTPSGSPAPAGSGAIPPTVAAVPGVAASATAARAASPGRSPAVDLREPRSVAQAYVDRWNAKDYNGMYELITGADQGTITRERFARRYENIAAEAGLAAVKATLGQPAPGTTQYPVRVEMTSSFVGPIAEDNTLAVRQDGGQWRVAWTPSLIFKDLGDGLIRFNPDLPARGRILDRKGRPLAQQGTVSQVGLIPEGIKDEAQFLDVLSKTLGLTPEEIKAKYATAQPNWYVPLKILPDPLPPEIEAQLKPVQGVAVRKVRDRVYPQGALAAHVVGYLGRVTEEELKTLAARGYTADDRIGRAGIEAWGEQYLAGKKGGQLTVVGQDEKFRALIAERKSEPAADITLTLDLDLQRALEEGLGDRPASGVILDPQSGGVLAMAAHPTYDPNGFILGFDDATWARLNDEAQRPLWNRAAQFAYPPGSIFKVITATAAIERLGMTPQTTIPCPAEYTLPGSPNVWKDWTYPNAQGPMTLQTSITRSCNTVNYELGRQLDARDSNTLPEFARAFGLGKPTGLEELPEARGTVPDPQWKRQTLNDGWATGDAINLAIGQGFLLTTPLQMANLYNALANGGALLRPFLAAAVTTPDGKVVRATERQETGRLPVPPATRAMLHTAMVDVISAPNGTAVKPFVGAPLAIAGKTGTAEVPPNPFHGWFASYAPAEAPKLTVLTMVENGGAGSEVAAPIARVVYDAYAALIPAP